MNIAVLPATHCVVNGARSRIRVADEWADEVAGGQNSVSANKMVTNMICRSFYVNKQTVTKIAIYA
jgi:hypothetical protein